MDWDFGDIFVTMIMVFFWFIFIWMFIGVFSDIFRRNDLSGVAKAGWIFLICVLPFLGILVYMIARPKMTEQDKALLEEAEASRQRATGYSAADEISKLTELHRSGAISDEEFERLKAKAIA
jgi:energy-coupling factor transporter transmembrane protein EcfT